MRTDLFDYDLPEALIAHRPPAERDGGRLLVLGRAGIEHARVVGWPERLPTGALVVLNDTRVFKARLLGRRRTGGKAELLLLGRAGAGPNGERWHALGRARRALREGDVLDFEDLGATVLARSADGTLQVELSTNGSVDELLERVGHVPLPPYIRRPDEPADAARYQTLFAERTGSVAAPTAGLHLSERILSRLADRGVEIGRLTLHVGPGTFRPVATDDLDDHPMHAEAIDVGEDVARQIAASRERGKPVVAVGTTVVRALESASDPDRPGHVRPTRGPTRLLIQPGYRFRVVDALLTNFHMPRSTLLALVAAFAGRERVLEAYEVAVREGYRLLSYGDAMWLPERAS